MSCTALLNPTLAEMAWCALTMATGSELLLVILLFCVFLYGIHTFRLPYQVFVPIGIMLLFIFAGVPALDSAGKLIAGTGIPLGGLHIFTSLMWIAVAFVGVIIALFFWSMKKG